MRMEPGAATIPHVHACREEFLILEGCLLLGLDWDPPGSREPNRVNPPTS